MQDAILFWNDVLLEVHRRDYTFDDAVGDDDSDAPIDRQNISPEVGGPTRVSRAFAMVHLATCDALSTIAPITIGGTAVAPYLSGLTGAPASAPGVGGAAVGAAASAVLLGLFKNETGFITGKLADWNALLTASGASAAAILVGHQYGNQVGGAMLASRANDGSAAPDAYVPLNVPGTHRADPFAPTQGALSVKWGAVKPFGELGMATTFVPAAPLGALPPGEHINVGAPWAAEVVRTRDKGGIPGTPGLTRTPEETLIGIFWGYDGTRNLGVPPRLYNQCLQSISRSQSLTENENAVLFALANMAMADAGITAWKTKIHLPCFPSGRWHPRGRGGIWQCARRFSSDVTCVGFASGITHPDHGRDCILAWHVGSEQFQERRRDMGPTRGATNKPEGWRAQSVRPHATFSRLSVRSCDVRRGLFRHRCGIPEQSEAENRPQQTNVHVRFGRMERSE
jgi:hypothetical protein